MPFRVPAAAADVTAEWFTALLRHRELLHGEERVAEVRLEPVGMTAGYFGLLSLSERDEAAVVAGPPRRAKTVLKASGAPGRVQISRKKSRKNRGTSAAP